METGLKVLLAIAGLGAAYLILKPRSPALPPMTPPPQPPVVPGRGGGLEGPATPPPAPQPPPNPPAVPQPPPSPPTTAPDGTRLAIVHSVRVDSPSGISPVVLGDRLRIQGIPPGFVVKADPPSAIRQLSLNDFLFAGPGTTTVVWAASPGEMRTVQFTLT